MGRRYFGTDGVRGVVGDALTADLVERLGRAATIWSGARRVFVGRDTRASGPEFERAFAEGVASAGAIAVLGGVLPTPAVALAPLDLGVVVSASHNPPEYNGIKLFDARGHKLSDAAEQEIEALLDGGSDASVERGAIERVDDAAAPYAGYVLEHFGADLSGLRIALDCANGAYAGLAPAVFERLGATVEAIGNEPNGENINVGRGATDTAELQRRVAGGGFDLGIAFDGDGDRMLAVDEHGELVDGDGIVAVLALDLGVDLVAVTQMTNHGFHALMRDRGIRVITTDVGDRYVLEALRREGGVLGGEQSGHILYLRDHVTGDGLVAGLLLCAALRGRPLSERTAVLPRWFQAKENVRVGSKELTEAVRTEVDRSNEALGDRGRVLVRPSGTEPVIRVLVEAENEAVAQERCARIVALVRAELG
jgi:phosphoglucosamine mutase